MQRRTLATYALSLLALSHPVMANSKKGVRIIVPFAAGGPLDLTARYLAQKLESTTKQSYWVQNKPGAAGVTGMLDAKKRKADGSTLLVTGVGPLSINKAILTNLSYDPVNDFTPITLISKTPNVLVITRNFAKTHSIKNFSDFYAWAKTQSSVTFASGGVGSIGHLAQLELAKKTGIKIQHVPYSGAHPALLSLMSGDTVAFIDNVANSMSLIESQELVALAVTTDSECELLPNVPTLTSQNIPIVMQTWISLMGPKGMKDSVVNDIRAKVIPILESEETKKKFLSLGAYATPSSTKELSELIKEEYLRYSKLF